MRKRDFVEYDDDDNLIGGDDDDIVDEREESRLAYERAMAQMRKKKAPAPSEEDDDDDSDEISEKAYEARKRAAAEREKKAAKEYETDGGPKRRPPERPARNSDNLSKKIVKQRETIASLEKKSTLFIVLWAITLMIAIGLGVFIIATRKKENSENVKIDGSTTKLTYSLDKVAKEFNSADYNASVKEINGYEYLCLSTVVDEKNINLYFQNEFPNDDNAANLMECFVTDGTNMVVVNSTYTFDSLETVLPKKVALGEDGSGFLYVAYTESGAPASLSLVNLKNMEKVGSVNFSSTFPYYFTVQVSDEAEKYVSVTNADATYNYDVDLTVYDKVVDNGSGALVFGEDFKYEITDTAFTFDASVSFGEGAQIGRYAGSIEYTATGLNMASAKFQAYVPADYEDPGKNQLLTPESEIWTDYYTTGGANGGTLLVKKYTVYPSAERDTSTLVRNDSGYWTWGDSTNGIDVSVYQGNVDWAAVKAAGTDFVFVRAGFRGYSGGSLATDDNFVKNVQGAQAAGLKVGVYFFTQAVNEAEGKEEGQYVVNLLSGMGVTGPVVIDSEYLMDPKDARGNLATREDRTLATKGFCETVAAAGYTPMIYASTRWLITGLNMDELADYKLWYAAYADSPLIDLDFAVWQYSPTGSVSGISGDVDVNIMLEDVFQ
ncbi:MAG: glycoside hydrolase family 25 protein [Lachnospiraceae bacterium]|nr:glycoside hydrolase family 25 protein [Lachnospiraceae bacterium]